MTTDAVRQRHDSQVSFLTKQYSSLLAPGFWERLWNKRHRLTLVQLYLLLLSQEMFFLGDYRSAIIRLAECIDTPEGMERHTANAVGGIGSFMEPLCGLLPSPDWVFHAGYAESRLVTPTVAKMIPTPSLKASVIDRLGQVGS